VKEKGRYDTSGSVENTFELGSRNRVLKNLPGIKGKKEMDRAETEALQEATDKALRIDSSAHTFKAADLCELHHLWLGKIYEWAGK